MKITPLSMLLCTCLVFAALMCGIFIGRNMSGDNIQVSALTTQPATQAQTTAASQTATSSAPAQIDGKININTADLYTLTKLSGIGEVYAQRIIDYRNEHGPFTNIVDITNVPGIGTKRFEAIMDKITVGG